MELALNCLTYLLFSVSEFSWYMFYFIIMEKLGLNEDKVASCLGVMDGAENLNIMRHLKI